MISQAFLVQDNFFIASRPWLFDPGDHYRKGFDFRLPITPALEPGDDLHIPCWRLTHHDSTTANVPNRASTIDFETENQKVKSLHPPLLSRVPTRSP